MTPLGFEHVPWPGNLPREDSHTPAHEAVGVEVAPVAAGEILGAQTGAHETGPIERLIAEVSAHALRNAADAWGEDGLEWLYLQGADDDVTNVQAVTKWLNERANQIEKGQL